MNIQYCQNQDIQDLRIYRMLLINCWFSFASLRENEYSILSESGYPGFKDLQDVIDKLLVFLCVFA
ncbi:hypothetical protein ANA_C12145 [Anabaena sp. 90]|nr:hypothetical protein ANA_C12145 [Anabaena sp. 90]